jgi:hypothetical protein
VGERKARPGSLRFRPESARLEQGSYEIRSIEAAFRIPSPQKPMPISGFCGGRFRDREAISRKPYHEPSRKKRKEKAARKEPLSDCCG